MKIGKLSFGKRWAHTPDFRWFYCPIGQSTLRKEFHFFWWFGHRWYIAWHK